MTDTTPAPTGADAALAQLRHLYRNIIEGGVRDTAQAKRIAEGLLAPAIAVLERAALASAAQPASAPAAVAEPVAWLHDDPQRYDVIHAEVKDLLVKSRDAAGHLHRPLDKSAHYTIPLYTAPAPVAQGDALPREDFAWLVVQEACDTEPADEDDPECIRILRRDLKSAVLAAFLRHDAARARAQAKEGQSYE